MAQELRDVWGNTVTLTQERRRHLGEHPEMRGQEDKLVETLLEPDVVVQSQSDETVRLFYRSYAGLAIGDKLLCLVAKYTPDNAFVITGYFTDRVKRGGVIWKR